MMKPNITALEVLTPKQLQMLSTAIEKEIPVLITGNRSIPTGKSFLCEFLRTCGVDVREEYELPNENVQDTGKNEVYFAIVLNEPLKHKEF